MAFVMGDTLKGVALDAIGARFDTDGTIVFRTAASGGGSVVATLAFSADAFASASGTGTVTMAANAITTDSNCAGGTIHENGGCVYDGAVLMGAFTCGTSAKDCNISSLTLAAGDALSCSSFVLSLA